MKTRIVLATLVAATVIGACGKKSDQTATDTTSGSAAMPHDTAGAMGQMSSDSGAMHGTMPMSGDMESNMQSMNSQMTAMLGTSDSLYDRRFIDMMIPHHESAIKMAEDASTKANRPEIKTLAQEIISAQRKEIDQLKSWRSKWYGSDTMGMAMGDQMRSMGDMMTSHLGASDSAYEDRFIDMMIPHHQGAIMMAQDAIQKATHSEIKQMAQSIIDAQQKEIGQMEQWRKEWYGH